MMDIRELTELGAKMGLTGGELLNFVKEQQQIARDERQQQRAEAEKERAEAEKQRAEAEKERAEAEKQRMFELAKLEKQAELQQNSNGNADLNSSRSSTSSREPNRIPTPKMPHFDEKEDLDAYLLRFERFATAQEWPEEQWALNLSLCLKGESLRVYSRLPPDDSQNYQKLKKALLKRFQFTEEGFRQKFRRERPKKGETSIQYMARLENYMARWLEMGGINKTFEEFSDLMLREQFLNVCSKELALFLREHDCKTSKALSELADKYLEAHHRDLEKCVKSFQTNQGNGKKPDGNPNSQEYKTKIVDAGENRNTRSAIKCFVCGKLGHKANDCRQRFKAQSAVATENAKPDKLGSSDGSQKDHRSGQTANLCLMKQIKESDSYSINLACGHEIPIVSAACEEPTDITEKILSDVKERMPVVEGYLKGRKVSVLRDSGCSGVIVRRDLISNDQLTGVDQLCVLIDGTVRKIPEAIVAVDTPFFTGSLKALCMKRPVYDLIIGNVPGVRGPENPDPDWSVKEVPSEQCEPHNVEETASVEIETSVESRDEPEIAADRMIPSDDVGDDSDIGGAVETRAQKQKRNENLKPLKTANVPMDDVTPEQLRQAQKEDSTLKNCFKHVGNPRPLKGKEGISEFILRNDILYRKVSGNDKPSDQLVVPEKFRNQVMKLAHDSIMAGHLGIAKTTDKVQSQFYWPGVGSDVMRYCKSCDICQRTSDKGRVTKVPLGHMPLIDTPFKRVAVDIVGPISPTSKHGNRYILTLVDYATRFPEAVPLRNIDTERVAEALVDIFSRVGVPSEILTDRGSQFTSDVMKEVSRLLSLRQLTTTPYHPICNGLVEKFNGTLKRMLKRMCEERPSDWDRYIGPLLFAYREAPQASTGFAPFELLYGRTVRGPMAILKEMWTSEVDNPETRSTYQYVLDLRERLEETCALARSELQESSERYKKYYNRKAKSRKFKPGDLVLILLPTDQNKLLMQWKGPFTVLSDLGKRPGQGVQ
ncbi:uncharacterized protein [Apostichopus japonicus]|uniref:uncharacterized protein n=1 Tax=Stichopus japonicus TaxID=307972 RepID=UPI003AB57DF9